MEFKVCDILTECKIRDLVITYGVDCEFRYEIIMSKDEDGYESNVIKTSDEKFYIDKYRFFDYRYEDNIFVVKVPDGWIEALLI